MVSFWRQVSFAALRTNISPTFTPAILRIPSRTRMQMFAVVLQARAACSLHGSQLDDACFLQERDGIVMP